MKTFFGQVLHSDREVHLGATTKQQLKVVAASKQGRVVTSLWEKSDGEIWCHITFTNENSPFSDTISIYRGPINPLKAKRDLQDSGVRIRQWKSFITKYLDILNWKEPARSRRIGKRGEILK